MEVVFGRIIQGIETNEKSSSQSTEKHRKELLKQIVVKEVIRLFRPLTCTLLLIHLLTSNTSKTNR